MVLPQLPNTLDWNTSNATSWVNYPVLLAALRGLVQLDARNEAQPCLAARWDPPRTTAEGHQRWVFHLRPNVRWSDGAPLVAEDFVLGARRVVQGSQAEELGAVAGVAEYSALRGARATPEALEAALAAVGVRALDEHTVEYELRAPSASFLVSLANLYTMFPAPSRALRGLTPAQVREYFENPRDGHPAALGPFRIESWDRAAERVRLVRNPLSSFAPPLAPGERAVEALVVQTSEVGVPLFHRGEVDFVTIDTATGILAAQGTAQRQQLLSTYFALLNVRRAPLDRVEVRRALALLVDRAAALAHLVPDARLARTLVPPSIPGALTASEIAALPATDVARARALLAAAGGVHRPLRLLFDGSPGIVPQGAVARRLARQLAAVGIELELDERHEDYAQRRRAGEWDLALRRIGADFAHPMNFLAVFRHDGSHATGWESLEGGEALARYERTLDQGEAEADPARAQPFFARAERQLLEEHVVLVPLYHPDRYYLVSPLVAGLQIDVFNFPSLQGARYARGAP